MIQGKYVNTSHVVRLKTLLESGDIADRTDIVIYDRRNRFLCRGKWYEDKILDYTDRLGRAKDKDANCVAFRLI